MLEAVFRIRSTMYDAIDKYFKSIGFCEVAPPILTPISCEVACVGGSDLISVDYYGKELYLSQSGQLYLELIALQLQKVYCISPTFRAESTVLATHLSEFWMCEAEIIEVNYEQLIQIAENLLKIVISSLLHEHEREIKELGTDIEILKKVNNGIPKLSYSEAINILQKKGINIFWGEDLKREHEKVLSSYMGNNPFFILYYPKAVSSFYKKECRDNPDTVLSFDVIAPFGVGELIGGSMRECDRNRLEKSLHLGGIDCNLYEWYLEKITKKQIEHGGFGLGIERVLLWICNLENISETIPFPRTKDNFWP